MWAYVGRGAAAGAAGTTALNAVTYLDMALRGRPVSRTPEESVDKLAALIGVRVPGGDEQTRANRVNGVGALLGMVTGVAIGVTCAALDERLGGLLERLPVPAASLAVGTVALLAANGPMVALGVSDPRSWTRADWASDLVPHAAYGLAAAYTYRATRP